MRLNYMSQLRFSDTILDDFAAPELSKLSNPTMPDIAEEPNQSLVFCLNYQLGRARFNKPAVVQAVVSSMHHHTSAVNAYRSARENLQKYVNDLPDHNFLWSVSQAISDLESCILHAHITALCLNEFQGSMTGKYFLDTGGQHEYARLRLLNNRVKHFDEDISKAIKKGVKSPARAIWPTDNEIVCARCTLSYVELAAILETHSKIVLYLAADYFKDPTKVHTIKII